MRTWWQTRSRAARVLLVLGTFLILLAVCGGLSANRGVEISKEEAIQIAAAHVDFEPQQTTVRFLRQGFSLDAVWAVSFSVRDGEGDFERITTVEVDAGDGAVLKVTRQE